MKHQTFHNLALILELALQNSSTVVSALELESCETIPADAAPWKFKLSPLLISARNGVIKGHNKITKLLVCKVNSSNNETFYRRSVKKRGVAS